MIGLMDENIETGWMQHHVGIALWRVSPGWALREDGGGWQPGYDKGELNVELLYVTLVVRFQMALT